MTSTLTLIVVGLADRLPAQGVLSGHWWYYPRPGLSQFRRWTAHALVEGDAQQALRSTVNDAPGTRPCMSVRKDGVAAQCHPRMYVSAYGP